MPKENFAVEGHALPFHRIMFEITRRCNLCCAHCFRGEPQNIDISEEIIDRSLDQISSCFSFDVTGGEPFLVPEKLEYLVDGIIKKKMRFTSFSLVVNGTILDERAQRSVAAINRLASHKVEFGENNRVKCNVQICANGNVTFGEQLSFESIDKFSMGNILEEPLSCIIWKNTFNQPLQCVEVTQLLNIKTKLEHGEVPDDEIEPNEAIVAMLKMKRDLMRAAHEKFPHLTYGELLEACDADLNIQTDGWYAFVMSKLFDSYRDKYKNWKYDRDTEQRICNRYIGENALREFTESVSEICENAKKNHH